MNKNSKFYLIGILLLIVFSGVTYAYLIAKTGKDADIPLSVTTSTTDSLVFSVDNDITITANPGNFGISAGNRDGVANAKAILRANNKTNNAVENYYLYFDIKENELTYTRNDKTAELLLQVNGPDGLLDDGDIAGLDYVTVTDGKGESISGFDITNKNELITIVKNREITTTSEKTDNWEIKVLFINLDSDQEANGGKKFNGELIIQKEEKDYHLICKSGTLACDVAKKYTEVQGENNIYYHKNLENSAEDKSYRYAGSYENVENYVCFGYDGTGTCPWDNMYRIIGVFDGQVKLIKADYAKSSQLGTSGDYKGTYSYIFSNYKGKLQKEVIATYYWNNKDAEKSKNDWAESRLNTVNLNGIYLNGFDSSWQGKIALTKWQVGGSNYPLIYSRSAAIVYQNEISNPTEKKTYSAKIGLTYMSDYGFGADPSAWTTSINNYKAEDNNNWMFNGLEEWSITKAYLTDQYALYLYFNGGTNFGFVYDNTTYGSAFAIRPVFYLNSNVLKVSGNGTYSSPYRIS